MLDLVTVDLVFPKMLKLLLRTAQKHDVDLSILSSVDAFNEERVNKITNKFILKANLKKGDQSKFTWIKF